MQKYLEDDLLLLSGIQHIAFCERQWALIHIEQVWAESVRTVEGEFFHKRVDDAFEDETRKNVRTVRAMPIVSFGLGLRGVADVVEFQRTDESLEGRTIKLAGRSGWWVTVPIEYKRGRPKPDDRDAVQLCAQAIALEEMLEIVIDSGELFYGETRRRETIIFDMRLRKHVCELSERMHKLVDEGRTPEAIKNKHCSLCSIYEMCQPNLTARHKPIKEYLKRMLDSEMMNI